MSGFGVLGAIIGVILGASGIGASFWAVTRTRGIQLTIDMIAAGNVELRAENERLHKKVADERVECAKEIAAMDGKLQGLTDGLAERIVRATVEAVSAGRQQGSAASPGGSREAGQT